MIANIIVDKSRNSCILHGRRGAIKKLQIPYWCTIA